MTTTRKLFIGIAVTMVTAGLFACNDGGTEPNPDTSITVSLTTPNTDDGAVLMVLTGAPLSEVQASTAAYQVFWRTAGPNETRVIVVGDIVAGPLFTAIAKGRASAVIATVAEVSTRSDQLRSATEGYSVTVTN